MSTKKNTLCRAVALHKVFLIIDNPLNRGFLSKHTNKCRFVSFMFQVNFLGVKLRVDCFDVLAVHIYACTRWQYCHGFLIYVMFRRSSQPGSVGKQFSVSRTTSPDWDIHNQTTKTTRQTSPTARDTSYGTSLIFPVV